jgi:hypothetical protein
MDRSLLDYSELRCLDEDELVSISDGRQYVAAPRNRMPLIPLMDVTLLCLTEPSFANLMREMSENKAQKLGLHIKCIRYTTVTHVV